jgi:hypothetical protein
MLRQIATVARPRVVDTKINGTAALSWIFASCIHAAR